MKHILMVLAFAAAGSASPLDDSARIVGGKPAKDGQFPYQVSVQNWREDLQRWIPGCGGVIVNQNWVLTAAHCLDHERKTRVLAGITNLKDNSTNLQLVELERKVLHPNFQGGVDPFDVGLLKVKPPFKLNNRVKAIGLPPLNKNTTGKVVLTGWGATTNESVVVIPDVLHTVEVPIISLKECVDAYEKIGFKVTLNATNVCTSGVGGIAACTGDSGGPIVQNNSVVGLVSWGILPCGYKNAPSVYANVAHFVDFITKTIK